MLTPGGGGCFVPLLSSKNQPRIFFPAIGFNDCEIGSESAVFRQYKKAVEVFCGKRLRNYRPALQVCNDDRCRIIRRQ